MTGRVQEMEVPQTTGLSSSLGYPPIAIQPLLSGANLAHTVGYSFKWSQGQERNLTPTAQRNFGWFYIAPMVFFLTKPTYQVNASSKYKL